MTYQVRVLARARRDLDEILAYVAERSPDGAARLLLSFEKCLTTLENNPFLSPLAPESGELQEQYFGIGFQCSSNADIVGTRHHRGNRVLLIMS
jgi:hypothetical protein